MKLGILLIAAMMLFGACSTQGQIDSIEGKKHDAAVPPPPPIDAPAPGLAGWASCSINGGSQACNLASSYCCFNMFETPNNGGCVGNGVACLIGGELHCDSDADCSAGHKCWARQFNDPDIDDAGSAGNLHIVGECLADQPSDALAHLCYPSDGTCNAGQACVQADPTAGLYAFSSAIYVCSPL